MTSIVPFITFGFTFPFELEFWEQVLSHESADPLQMKRLHLRRVHCFELVCVLTIPGLIYACFRGGMKVLSRMYLQYLCWHNHPEWCA